MTRESDLKETVERNGKRNHSPKFSESSGTSSLSLLLLDSLEEAVAEIGLDWRIRVANRRWRELTGEFPWLRASKEEKLVIDEAALRQLYSDAEEMLSGLRCVFTGEAPEFRHELTMQHSAGARCFTVWAKRLDQEAGGAVCLIIREVTEQRKTEQELRESHSLFQRVIEGTNDGIFLYSRDGVVLMHNSAGATLLGFKFSRVVGRKIEDIVPWGVAQTILERNELVMSTGQSIGYELKLNTPQGWRVAQVQKGVYRNHRDEAVGVIAIARDITERKLAEEKLKQSEDHFRALIEKSADCITLISAEGTINYISPSVKTISGHDPIELVGTSLFFWVHPEDLKGVRAQFLELLSLPGASVHAEFRHLCKDGCWKWLEGTVSNFLQDPSVHAVVGNVRDITERKEAEQSQRRFEAIVESSIDAIIGIDLDGKIASWNPAAQRIFGYPEAKALGREFLALVPEECMPEMRAFLAEVQQGKAVKDYETVFVGRNERRVEVSLTISPIIPHEHHTAGGGAVIVRDITERRRLEKEVLEIADFEKHRIGQDLHDDLCQHLIGISMLGNLLHTDLSRLGLKQAEDARNITVMIRNAVEHARILAKGLSPLNMQEGGLMAGLETLAANTEQLFRMPCAFECGAAVHLDNPEVATHLFRIAQEAVHNAVKHSQGSNVTIRLSMVEEALEIVVSDNGIGLRAKVGSPEGGGLGMHTMVYRARIIGAELSMCENPGGGTRVVCRLPDAHTKSTGCGCRIRG